MTAGRSAESPVGSDRSGDHRCKRLEPFASISLIDLQGTQGCMLLVSATGRDRPTGGGGERLMVLLHSGHRDRKQEPMTDTRCTCRRRNPYQHHRSPGAPGRCGCVEALTG